MNKTLQNRIESFLSEKRKSSGGWAEITDGDVAALSVIIDQLIKLKCEPDPDGDYPINFALVNRRVGRWPFKPITISYDLDSQDIQYFLSIITDLTKEVVAYFRDKEVITYLKDGR